MTYVWEIVNYLKYIAGIACAVALLVSIFKVMIGDEQDTKKYIKRAKNAIIGLVLIFTIVNLANIVLNYFANDEGDVTYSIGSIYDTDIELPDGTNSVMYDTALDVYNDVKNNIYSGWSSLIANGEGSKGNGTFLIGNTWYYVSDFYNKKNVGTITNPYWAYGVLVLTNYTTGSDDYYCVSNGTFYDSGSSSVIEAVQQLLGYTSTTYKISAMRNYFKWKRRI